jgi:hypothetical protein
LQINDLTYVFSSTWQKSAQIIENRYFQVPVFCDTCALFGWKPRVFSILTKSTPTVYAPMLTEKSTADPSSSATADSLGVTALRPGAKAKATERSLGFGRDDARGKGQKKGG